MEGIFLIFWEFPNIHHHPRVGVPGLEIPVANPGHGTTLNGEKSTVTSLTSQICQNFDTSSFPKLMIKLDIFFGWFVGKIQGSFC